MKEFGYPIPYEDFWELLDPNPSSVFHRPFDFGHGETALANGRMVLRTQQAIHESDKVPFDDCVEARERIAELDWQFFDYPDQKNLRPGAVTGWSNRWKSLADRGGSLVRPELAAWEPTLKPENRGGFDFVTRPRIAVGETPLILPIPVMQLVRRLPNVQVWTGRRTFHSPHAPNFQFLPIRFTYGIGYVSSVLMRDGIPHDREPARYGIWTPKSDPALERLIPPR